MAKKLNRKSQFRTEQTRTLRLQVNQKLDWLFEGFLTRQEAAEQIERLITEMPRYSDMQADLFGEAM